MQSSDIPSVFNIPWANDAIAPYIHAIPEASQIAITPGAASLTDGFVPLNFLQPAAGGVPPFGNDMNGILNQITAWLRWGQAGGPVRYSSTFQTAIGGYPLGAIVQSATVPGKQWVSTTENNVTDPDTGGAGWITALNTVYAPLNGAGTSGTWPISITGNAATAGISGTFTVTITGLTVALTAVAKYTVVGGKVNLYIPADTLFGTSNSTTMTITGLPVGIQPASLVRTGVFAARDNSTTTAAYAEIYLDTITFVALSSTMTPISWTASGVKGLQFSMTEYVYTLP